MKKIGIYTRVSTSQQLDGYSLGEQKERLVSYCKAKGWEHYKIYSDGGYSGGSINRPSLQQLIEDVKNKKIDTIVVYKLDRLSRSQKDTLYIIEDILLPNECDFISVSENFDTSTPYGKAMIGLLSVFAQLERENIKQRMTLGKVARAKSGKYMNGSYVLIGYNYINGELVVNELEAIQVKKIFEMFLKGKSVNAIQQYMHNNYSSKYGNYGSQTTIKQILRNRTYIGEVQFKGKWYKGIHEPIISKEEFEQVNEMIDATPTDKTRFKAKTLLGGKITCAYCGKKMHMRSKKMVKSEYQRYACSSNKNKKTCFESKLHKINDIDTMVLKEIKSLKYSDSKLDVLLDKNGKNARKIDENKAIEKELSLLKKQISRLLDLYANDKLPYDAINEKLEEINNKKMLLEKQLIKKEKIISKEDILNKIKDIDNIQNLTIEEQRMYLDSIIENITVYNDKIEIHWAF